MKFKLAKRESNQHLILRNTNWDIINVSLKDTANRKCLIIAHLLKDIVVVMIHHKNIRIASLIHELNRDFSLREAAVLQSTI